MATRKQAQPADLDPSTPAPAATLANCATDDAIQAAMHRARRKNSPPAGIDAQGRVEESPKVRHHYNPHLPPVLRFATDPAATDGLPALLQIARQHALSEEEAQVLRVRRPMLPARRRSRHRQPLR